MSDKSIFKSGHPRTLMAHQDARMRAQQRAAARNSIPTVDKNALHADTVVAINRFGGVRLSRFTDTDSGAGQFFVCLNHTAPRIGDVVIYTYVDDVPVVLGKMPDDRTSWLVPEEHGGQDYQFDDFDINVGGASGNLGLWRWVVSTQSSGSFTMSAGLADHPGYLSLTSTTIVGSYAVAAPGASSFGPSESLYQVGFCFRPTNMSNGGQVLVALSDTFAFTGNYVDLVYNSGDAGWTLGYKNGATSGSAALNMAYSDQSWYRAIFTRVAEGTWQVALYDIDNDIEGGAVINGAASFVAFPMARCYSLTTAITRQIDLDYCFFSRRMLNR